MSPAFGHRPVRRDAARLGIDNRRLGGLAEFDFIPLMTGEVEMGRPRRVRQGGAPGMSQQPRQLGGQIDGRRKLGHGGKKRRVRNFLVRIAMLKRSWLAAGQRDDRARPRKGSCKSGSEIGGADRLRHAHPRPPRNPGISVGHISRRLFRMREDRGHPEILQLQQRAAQHRLDKEDVRSARTGQCPCQPFGAIHRSVFTHLYFLPRKPLSALQGEREGPSRERREGEVGGAAVRSGRLPTAPPSPPRRRVLLSTGQLRKTSDDFVFPQPPDFWSGV